MHHAVVVRSPVFGGTVASIDSAPALAVDGVTDVLEIDTGVAVVATSYWQARKGAQALAVEWQGGDSADVSSASVRADYESATDDDGNEAHAEGDFGTAFAAASDTLEATWWAPYLAHAPMEPMNAVAHVRADSAEVWAGTQGPGPTRGLVARHADLEPEQVTVHQTWLGGGFGRRGTVRYVAEATQISRATGKPVKVLWSREDDLRAGLYRPASLMRIRAGLDADGRISAWEAKRVGGNITPDTLENVLPAVLPGAPQGVIDAAVGLADKATRDWVVDNASIEGFYEDYDLPNFSVRHVTRDHGVPLTFWRSVGHSYTAFAKKRPWMSSPSEQGRIRSRSASPICRAIRAFAMSSRSRTAKWRAWAPRPDAISASPRTVPSSPTSQRWPRCRWRTAASEFTRCSASSTAVRP